MLLILLMIFSWTSEATKKLSRESIKINRSIPKFKSKHKFSQGVDRGIPDSGSVEVVDVAFEIIEEQRKEKQGYTKQRVLCAGACRDVNVRGLDLTARNWIKDRFYCRRMYRSYTSKAYTCMVKEKPASEDREEYYSQDRKGKVGILNTYRELLHFKFGYTLDAGQLEKNKKKKRRKRKRRRD